MRIKEFFENEVKTALLKAVNNNELSGFDKENIPPFLCEIPKNPEFGDFSINVSSLARFAKIPPVKIAEIVKNNIEDKNFETSFVQGFVNFKLNEKFLIEILKEILKEKENYGKINLGKGKKVNIEYVSANPTGPFHIGHGRWAAIGSSLAEILKFTGYEVFQEFYINDAGMQIKRLGKSLENRVKELKGESVEWDDDLYKGDYLIPCAKKYIEDNKGLSFEEFAKQDMLQLQKELLQKFRTNFDLFFSETSLYENNEVQECINKLKENGKLYEKDGAIWFKSSEYTDSQDRVLKKSDGTNTYLTADIAYHINKLKRSDFLIDIWGADHHGYIPRMKASIDALGYNSENLEVLLGQLVNIIENGEAVRMGKRKKMVTLGELVDEVGVDSTRYWMLMRSIDTTLDFDVELAKTKSDKNPVFYAQYAHARCASILRRAFESSVDIETKEVMHPYIEKEEFDSMVQNFNLDSIFSKDDEKSNESIKKLLLRLEEFKSVIEASSRLRAPYMICKFVQDLACDLHHFYNFTRVMTEDKELGKARLLMVYAVKNVLAQAFSLIKVDALERM